MYIPCYFGDEVTSGFGDMTDFTYELSWYEYPSDISKLIPFILQVAQLDVNLEGFGNIVCSRELFTKVCLKC